MDSLSCKIKNKNKYALLCKKNITSNQKQPTAYYDLKATLTKAMSIVYILIKKLDTCHSTRLGGGRTC